MSGIEIKGLDKLERQLKKNVSLNDVKRVVRHNGAQLQQKIQRNAEFEKGYQTGRTKESVGLDIVDSGMTAESGPATDYAPYVERGTRFMDAQPFVEPALEEQEKKFQSDMQKLVK